MKDIIGNKKIFLGISALLLTASLAAVLFFGLKPGIDFSGGTSWQVRFSETGKNTNEVRDFFENDLGVKSVTVFPSENNTFIIRFGEISETDHRSFAESLADKFGEFEELRYDSIGPVVGNEVRSRALWAVALVLIGISLFVAYAFRKVSYPVTSWKYGVVTLFTLLHDVIIPTGLIAVLGHYAGVEIDVSFVVALLVVMGFSVHDTIVVFDRIRENLLVERRGMSFDDIVNKSINQTLARSINTSLTLVIVLAALLAFGPPTLTYFVLVILVGVVMGTYSSVFVASPLLTIWKKFSKI